MLNYRNVNIASIIFFIVSIYLIFHGGVIFFFFPFLLIFLRLGFLAYGSFSISSDFYLKAVCRTDTNSNKIALTFDDGPNPITPAILSLLKKYEVKAAFFVIGSKAEKFPDILYQIHTSGHILGNHSYYHSNLFAFSSVPGIKDEIKRTNDIVFNICGVMMKFFRPPFGVTNPRIARAVKKMAMNVIGWSVRSFDTRGGNPDKILYKVEKKIRGGDIVLFHDSSDNILYLIERLIIDSKQKGLEFVRLDELTGLKAYEN